MEGYKKNNEGMMQGKEKEEPGARQLEHTKNGTAADKECPTGDEESALMNTKNASGLIDGVEREKNTRVENTRVGRTTGKVECVSSHEKKKWQTKRKTCVHARTCTGLAALRARPRSGRAGRGACAPTPPPLPPPRGEVVAWRGGGGGGGSVGAAAWPSPPPPANRATIWAARSTARATAARSAGGGGGGWAAAAGEADAETSPAVRSRVRRTQCARTAVHSPCRAARRAAAACSSATGALAPAVAVGVGGGGGGGGVGATDGGGGGADPPLPPPETAPPPDAGCGGGPDVAAAAVSAIRATTAAGAALAAANPASAAQPTERGVR